MDFDTSELMAMLYAIPKNKRTQTFKKEFKIVLMDAISASRALNASDDDARLHFATDQRPAGQGDGPPAGQGDGPPAVQGDGPPAVQGDGSPAVQGDGSTAVQGDGSPAGQTVLPADQDAAAKHHKRKNDLSCYDVDTILSKTWSGSIDRSNEQSDDWTIVSLDAAEHPTVEQLHALQSILTVNSGPQTMWQVYIAYHLAIYKMAGSDCSAAQLEHQADALRVELKKPGALSSRPSGGIKHMMTRMAEMSGKKERSLDKQRDIFEYIILYPTEFCQMLSHEAVPLKITHAQKCISFALTFRKLDEDAPERQDMLPTVNKFITSLQTADNRNLLRRVFGLPERPDDKDPVIRKALITEGEKRLAADEDNE
ncbi:hypothetical protein J8273_6723 [Carpediemonas membranifera]|uniref:Uncharacterized protein n=1 Tax=Carpediemonas membranifera TaxID=201153 RepID=A0A8J6ARC5_9EUKA|nr:hypothetical protein J8273_6723 [Carpediemonas membranifera]|eukprot:KAG9391993.1 hypothetical protein J8273_6723 [Carpediemonas membranifera]